jgi:hypothetical protein
MGKWRESLSHSYPISTGISEENPLESRKLPNWELQEENVMDSPAKMLYSYGWR